VTASDVPDISPEEASQGGADHLPDELLPSLAAVWLAEDHDSEELREFAALSERESRQTGRRLFADVLASLGHPVRDRGASPEELPWLGYWHQIKFAQDEMDRRLTPYAAAQRVIAVGGDVPDLWAPAGGQRLMSLVQKWDERPSERSRIDQLIRDHIRALKVEDAPALISGR
jgi:hypothetical protein